MVQTVIAATVAAVVLQKVKPVERIPFSLVANNAGFVELLVGVAMYYGLGMKQVKAQWVRGVAAGMVISGAMKVADRFLPAMA